MFDAKKLLDDLLNGGQGRKDAIGEIGGLVGAVFSQAKDGLQEGASEIEKRTGVGAKADEALKGATGKSASEMIEQAKDFASRNKLATGAAAGGLAALLLGTGVGRGMTGGAVKLGGLALIGGLAYKAYQNHKEGKPLINTPGSTSTGTVELAPAESPFGETGDDAQDQKVSMLVVRAMIAAAACDGEISNDERSRIVGDLQTSGLDVQAARFLDEEFHRPATAAELAADATTTELKMEVYAAARVVIAEVSMPEAQFLKELAEKLGLTNDQVAHLEATVAQAKEV